MKLTLIGVMFCIFLTLIAADKQSIRVWGGIRCCKNTTVTNECEAPNKAKIELWDYFKVFPNVLLYYLEIEKTINYSFIWSDSKFFTVKPFLKIHVQCSDRTSFDGKYDFTKKESYLGDIVSKEILQSVTIKMDPK